MGWWSWESQNWGLLSRGGKTASSRSCTVTPGRLNYYQHTGGKVKTMGGFSSSLHRKTRAAPAHECAWLPIPEEDAGTWGLTSISGHCLVWGCSAGSLEPASHPELIPALLLLWPAQPVLRPAQGSVAWVSASAGHPVLQTGMGDDVWQFGVSPPLPPHIPRSQSCSLQGQDCSQAAGGPKWHRCCCGLGVLPSQMAEGDTFATPLTSLDGLRGSIQLQTTIH